MRRSLGACTAMPTLVAIRARCMQLEAFQVAAPGAQAEAPTAPA